MHWRIASSDWSVACAEPPGAAKSIACRHKISLRCHPGADCSEGVVQGERQSIETFKMNPFGGFGDSMGNFGAYLGSRALNCARLNRPLLQERIALATLRRTQQIFCLHAGTFALAFRVNADSACAEMFANVLRKF